MIYGKGNAPLSAYVDRGSVQIGETLRNRYVQNFQAADELQAQLDLLNSTKFEGDLKLRSELEKNTRGKLEQLADRGDYENLSLAVNRTNRNFQKQYSPIKQNYDKYQAYQADVQKRYDEGLINSETYNKALAASSHDYKGLQLDAEGNVERDSFFTGMNLVKDVNISELVNESIKGMMPNEDILDITQVDGNMLVRTKDGVKKIEADRVQRIYQEVVSRPDVRASLNQTAKLRTYNLADEDKAGIVAEDIANLSGSMREQQKALNSSEYTAEEKIGIQSNINALQSQINKLNAVDATNIDEHIRSRTIESILDPIEKSVLAKNVYTQTETVRAEDFNKVYMAHLNNDLAIARQIAKENREEAKLDTGMISYKGDSIIFATHSNMEDSSNSINSKYDNIAAYDAIINDATQSAEAVQNAKNQKLVVTNDIAAESRSLGYVAQEALRLNPELKGLDQSNPESTNYNPYWFDAASDDAKDAINDVLQDKSNSAFYHERPQEVEYLTEGGKAWTNFETGFKKAFKTLPSNFKGYEVPKTGTVDVAALPNENFGQLKDGKYKGATIDDVALTMGGVAGTASSGQYLSLTLSGGDDGELAGERVLVPLDQIESSLVNDLLNDPEYKLNMRMNQARKGQGDSQKFAAVMDNRTTDDDGNTVIQTVNMGITMYPSGESAGAGDQVTFTYLNPTTGVMETTPRMSIDAALNGNSDSSILSDGNLSNLIL